MFNKSVQIKHLKLIRIIAFTIVLSLTTPCGCIEKSTNDNANDNMTSVLPLAPGNLIATAVSSVRINLTWEDNSDSEDGFKIERSLDGIAYTEISTVSVDEISFSDSGLDSNTKYYHRVRAYNDAGDSEYSNFASETTHVYNPSNHIIADHTIVDKYEYIPQSYIDEVKKMWINIPGESHSEAYRRGLELLETLDSKFAVNATESGTPEASTDQHLRISRATRNQYSNWSYGYGESDWYTNEDGITQTKNHIEYCETHDLHISAIGFGWCWDMTWLNAPGGTEDPVYHVRWAGSSVDGPDGNKIWGLDAGDYSLTGNHVCMDTYLNATQQYIDFCTDNSYTTKVIFTTGPVDGHESGNENGYQRHIKHEYIRNYVKDDTSRILFDYADILCYDDDGSSKTATWNTNVYPVITLTNKGDGTIGHIGSAGAVRLAKAIWWMLARIAGWDGE